jgi:charged multivesicular body protein 5
MCWFTDNYNSLFDVLILCAELDALEADMDFESNSVPSYLQPDKESDLDSELNLPAAPSGHAVTPNRQQVRHL